MHSKIVQWYSYIWLMLIWCYSFDKSPLFLIYMLLYVNVIYLCYLCRCCWLLDNWNFNIKAKKVQFGDICWHAGACWWRYEICIWCGWFYSLVGWVNCLHGGGGPQIAEVSCGRSPHLSCKRDQIKMRDYMDRVTPLTVWHKFLRVLIFAVFPAIRKNKFPQTKITANIFPAIIYSRENLNFLHKNTVVRNRVCSITTCVFCSETKGYTMK